MVLVDQFLVFQNILSRLPQPSPTDRNLELHLLHRTPSWGGGTFVQGQLYLNSDNPRYLNFK
jgi:hypothetical protein